MTALVCLTGMAALCHGQVAIRNVTVIDVEGGPSLKGQTVILAGTKISAIAANRLARLPAGATQVDGTGKYLIPGLWDMHVHLWEASSMFPLYVAAGVTGVRDMGSDPQRVRAWIREVESGKTLGPAIYTAGKPIDGPESESARFPVHRALTPEDGRRAVDTLYREQADFAKVLSTLSRDAYLAAAQRARLLRLPLAGHVPESVSVLEAIDARQASMEHLFGMMLACSPEEERLRLDRAEAIRKNDNAELRRIRERSYATYSPERAAAIFQRLARYSVWQTPTLTLRRRLALLDLDQLVEDERMRHVPAAVRKRWKDPREDRRRASASLLADFRVDFDKHLELTGAMARAGVPLLAGTDTGDPFVLPGFALHDELELLVKAGLQPSEALRAATSNPARFLGRESTAGSVRPGRAADLVLLEADPLADIRNTRKIAAVFLQGRYLPASRLAQVLTEGHSFAVTAR